MVVLKSYMHSEYSDKDSMEVEPTIDIKTMLDQIQFDSLKSIKMTIVKLDINHSHMLIMRYIISLYTYINFEHYSNVTFLNKSIKIITNIINK